MNEQTLVMMTQNELNDLLDRYGTDWENWPLDAREQAERLIATDQQAAALYRAATLIDTALASNAPTPPAPAGLLDRVMEKIK